MEYAIRISNLTKTYKSTKVKALDSLSLNIKSGLIFGLLGQNGAGKSTLIKCVVDLIKPDNGTIEIFGKPMEKSRNLVGYLPEQSSLYEFLTGMNFLETIASLRNIKRKMLCQRIDELRDFFVLPDLNKLLSSYSKGNKEKILFVSMVIHKPKLLILDEPFTGFDPAAIYKAKQFIQWYVAQGNSVILSTHILEMAAQLCDEIAIISDGRIKGQHSIDKSLAGNDSFNELENLFMQEVGITNAVE